MSDQRYRSAIDAAIEEPGVDFKAATSWSKASACARFELLKDIAAMCCYGGGLIVIGRNDEDKKTGSLSEEQAASFETTKVNEFARQYLRPLPPLRVVSLEHGEDRLAILDVPGFAEIPPCFQKDSQCPNRAHIDRRMHFRRGDVFIRTPASQTTRLCDPEDWRVIWSQMQRNIRQSVSFSSAADETDDETEDPYTTEYEEEEQNFRLPFGVVNTMGIVELDVRPETYIKDRVPRGRLREVLTSARATAAMPSAGKTVSTPYEQTELRNTLSGIMLVRNSLETREFESGILRSSGFLMFRRIWPEEYNETGAIEMVHRKLPFLGLALQLRLLLEFASRFVQSIAPSEEAMDLTVAVGGLANRTIDDDSRRYGVPVPSLSALGGPGHAGTEQGVVLRRSVTVGDLAACHASLAVEVYQDVLWSFGIDASSMAVTALQGGSTPEEISGKAAN